jgi:hypothetical protein
MNARERRRFAMIGLCGFIASAVSLAPAGVSAWALKRSVPTLSIAGAEGTIWRGGFSGVSHNGVLIGDIRYRLSALPLLLGRLSIAADSANGALTGRARLSLGGGGAEFRDVAAQFNLGAIRQYTFFGVRYQGLASLKADRLKLTDKECLADAASLSTSAFEALTNNLSGGPFPLAGPIECRGGAIHVALAGEGADGKAAVGLTIRPDLTYTVRIAADPRRPDVSRALQLFGFESEGAGLSYEAAGVLKGLSS